MLEIESGINDDHGGEGQLVIIFASGTEDPGSDPARAQGEQSNAVM
jgi:hypothetical protein